MKIDKEQVHTMKKRVLYIDKAFMDRLGGDKNRSYMIYSALKSEYDCFYTQVLICIDTEEEGANISIQGHKKKGILYVDNQVYFSDLQKRKIFDYIKKENIDTLFFRSSAFMELAYYIYKYSKDIHIIVDVDLLLSRLLKQVWDKNPCFKQRYFLLEHLKQKHLQKIMFSYPFTYLFSSKIELRFLQKQYNNTHIQYLQNTTELTEHPFIDNKSRKILFYGAMDSSSNIEAYTFLAEQIFPLVQEHLKKEGYTLEVGGKSSLDLKAYDGIKRIGRLDKLQEKILQAEIILLPIGIASGTNTRVIESAILGKMIITTPLGIEGLGIDSNLESVVSLAKEFSDVIIKSLNNPSYQRRLAKKMQVPIVKTYLRSHFEKDLYSLINANKATRIIHIPRRFTKNSWGGIESVILHSTKALQKLGYLNRVYTTKALDNNKTDLIDESIQIRRFNYFYPIFPLRKQLKENFDNVGGNLFSYSLLVSLLLSKVDLIHLHTIKRMGAIGRTVARWKNIPYIVTIHGGYFDRNISTQEDDNSLYYTFEWGKILGWFFGSRRVLDDASSIITLSKKEYEKMYAMYKDKVHLVSNGVDIESFQRARAEPFLEYAGLDKDKEIILCSARIDPQKNQLELLKAFQSLSCIHPNLHLLFLGAVSSKEYLKTLTSYIVKHSLEKRVTLIHTLNAYDNLLYSAYKASRMLVLPSIHEPFGIVILEAWAASLPVISSDNSGAKILIEDKVNGYIYPLDNTQALVEKILCLRYQTLQVEKMIGCAKERVEAYAWKEVIKVVDEIYIRTIKQYSKAEVK